MSKLSFDYMDSKEAKDSIGKEVRKFLRKKLNPLEYEILNLNFDEKNQSWPEIKEIIDRIFPHMKKYSVDKIRKDFERKILPKAKKLVIERLSKEDCEQIRELLKKEDKNNYSEESQIYYEDT